jgi:hypothetical protein
MRILRAFKSELGTVESALVLIPTILLFLSVLQIAASVLGRGVAVNIVQGEVSREALFGSGEFLVGSKTGPIILSRIPLPGGGAIISGTRESLVPKLTPLIILQDKFTATGIAIDEN